jgi:hypothetical protein
MLEPRILITKYSYSEIVLNLATFYIQYIVKYNAKLHFMSTIHTTKLFIPHSSHFVSVLKAVRFKNISEGIKLSIMFKSN